MIVPVPRPGFKGRFSFTGVVHAPVPSLQSVTRTDDLRSSPGVQGRGKERGR